MEIKIGAECESATNEPAKERSENAAKQPHDPSFDEEKLFDVAVGCAESFQDANFAAALENSHDQSVDDTERGDGEREAAEDAEKKIEHGEKDAQALGCIEKRERAEAQILELGFGSFYQRGALHADSKAGVRGLVAGRIAKNVAQVVDLRGAQRLCDRKWNEQ